LEHVGANALLNAEATKVRSADGLVVPGVGAFAACMNGLKAVGAGDLMRERIAVGRSVLGICVGMQVLFERGVEHGVASEGLGMWAGVVDQLDASTLPHMGWNTVTPADDSVLFDGVAKARFYFVHSYAARGWVTEQKAGDAASPKLTWGTHDGPFLAAIEDGVLSATQFHPEKSGEAGSKLLGNWLRTL
jgi:glutamine amidotransferase